MSAPSACFDDSTALRSARGHLSTAEQDSISQHVKSCADCAARLARAKDSVDAITAGDSSDALTRQEGSLRARPPSGAVAAGSRVGRFIVLDQLGEGGMGRVVRAYDPQLNRRVAIKLLRSDVGQKARELAQARLLREAQAMARARHPNLVAVFDAGTEGDQVFLAMELVEGESLEGWLKKPRHWRDVLRIFLDAGRGLAAAHAVNLVHRDFKPANVLLGPDGRAQVTDFGIAHLQAGTGPTAPPFGAEIDSATSSERLTRAGNVVGTPRYMSPQQHTGEPLDARSDQFSFCVVLYEALYGQLPFEGKKVDARLEQMEKGEVRPPPPEARAPKWLFAAIRRGLAFQPEQRFPSMDALIAHLEQRLARRRLRQLATAGGLAALAVAGAFALSLRARPSPCAFGAEVLEPAWGPEREAAIQHAFERASDPSAQVVRRSTREALDRYARSWLSMRRDACLETRVRGTQTESMLQLRMLCLDRRRASLEALGQLLSAGDKAVLGRAAEAAASLPPLEDCADAAHLALEDEGETAAQRAAGAALRPELESARALVLAGQAQRARAALEPLISKARAADSPAALAEALYLFGRAASQSHDEKAARPALTEALQLALQTRYDALAADAAASLVYAAAEDPSASALAVPFARGVVARAGSPPGADSLLHHAIGAADYAAGHYGDAAKEFAQAATIAESKLGPDHPRTLSSLIAEAESLSMTGEVAQALALGQRVLGAQERNLGPQNSRLVPTLLTVSDQLLESGRPEQARPLLERAKAMCRRDLGPNSPSEDAVDERLAQVEAAAGHPESARALLEHALADRLQKSGGVEGPSTAGLRVALARTLMQQGELAAAQEQAQRAYKATARLEPDSPDLADPLTVLGELALARGDTAGAKETLERALALRAEGNAPPREDARTRFALARALGPTARGRQLATEAQARVVGEPLADEIARWLAGAR